MLSGLTAGILSFITGVTAIVKQKERSFVVYLATIIGSLITIFIIGELIS